jgi:serine/threonine-protein kinase
MERALGSRYTLGEPLGSGAMGQVFAGTDVEGDSHAFKVLHADLTRNPDVVSRFLQERSILVGLRHPNLVAVHDLVVEGDTVAIVMDLVLGGDLRQMLRTAGTLLPAEVARVGSAIAAALAQVHAAGVVHRDVKPENVLMDGGIPRLTDFGISKLANSSMTGRSSLLAGTPQYVAPELAEGHDPTPAADLYSLGIMLYELCCGVTPFTGQSMLAVIRMHAEAEPGRPDGIPDSLWELINWLLRKTPRARPQSAHQVATLLEALVPQLANCPVALPLTSPPLAAPIAHGRTTQAALPSSGNVLPRLPSAPPVRGKRRRLLSIAVIVLTLAVGGVAAVIALRPADSAPNDPISAAGPASGQARPASAAPPTTATTTSEVELTVAPGLIGRKLAEAQDMLPSSLKVETVDSIEQTAQPGTVIDQSPKQGEPLNGKIKLTVAREPAQIYLDELEAINKDWTVRSNRAGSLGGKSIPHTVAAAVSKCSDADAEIVEYTISKGYRRFLATVGIDDNSQDTALKVQLEIFGDGRKLATQVVEYGKPTELSADLSGVLRLKFQWQPQAGSMCGGDSWMNMGEARLLGLPGEMPTSGVVSPSGSSTGSSTTTTTTR